MSKVTLHSYQQRAVDHLLEHPSAALFLDMGLGKTVVTLTALAELIDSLEIHKVLIVAPLRVVQTTWPAEIRKWDHVNWLRYRFVRGALHKQLAIARADRAPIHLVNYEQLGRLCNALGDEWPYDVVVLDESSKMKSHASQRFTALRRVRTHIARVIELTGTPAPNGLHDLWSQIYLLDGGTRLGRTVTAFRDRWFVKQPWSYRYEIQPWAEEQIHARLADVCLTMRAEDYLELPPYIENVISVPLPEAKREQYRELEREMYLELEESEVEAVNAAVLSSKCHQYANGQLYDSTGRWEAVHGVKLDALADVIEEAAGQSVLVAYSFRADLERLRERFPSACVLSEDSTAVDRWNRREIPLMLAHPASAGHGLNLQDGGHIICWYGLNWSLELYQQFNARLYRQGQAQPVMVHHLVTEGTVDVDILRRLRTKCSVQDALLDSLKRRKAA